MSRHEPQRYTEVVEEQRDRKKESESSPSPAHDLVTDPEASPQGLSTLQTTPLHPGIRENSYRVREK